MTMKNLFNGKKAFLTIPLAALIVLFIIGSVAGLSPPSKDQPAQITKTPGSKVEGVQTQTVESTAIPTIQSWPEAKVVKVVDGDTLSVSLNGKTETVRVIGIDTPETVDPRRPVGCFGKEASNKAKELLSEKEIILQKDVSETDKYRRLLRYVFLPLPDGRILFANDYLVREGFAKVLTYPPDVKYNEQFRQAEREAREDNRGLWGKCK